MLPRHITTPLSGGSALCITLHRALPTPQILGADRLILEAQHTSSIILMRLACMITMLLQTIPNTATVDRPRDVCLPCFFLHAGFKGQPFRYITLIGCYHTR